MKMLDKKGEQSKMNIVTIPLKLMLLKPVKKFIHTERLTIQSHGNCTMH